jgi:hypothetical protein
MTVDAISSSPARPHFAFAGLKGRGGARRQWPPVLAGNGWDRDEQRVELLELTK